MRDNEKTIKSRYDSLDYFIRDVIGKDLKIAILVAYFLKGHGVAHVVKTQAKELVSNNYDVTIFTLESNILPPQNVNLIKIGAPDNMYLKAINQIIFPINLKNYRILSKIKKYDLIINHQHVLAWIAFFAKRRYGIPFIYYNHPVVSERELYHNIPYWLFMKFNELSFNFFAKTADYVISISEYARRLLYEKSGIDSIVIYNTIDTIFQQKVDGKIIREKYGLKNDPIILFVGRIIPLKGIHLLLNAFKLVKREVPNSKLIIVGTHKFKDYSKKLAELSTPFGKDVIFTGYVPDEELPYYYAACNVYATASLHEGFNLPALEAQAYGKPVVAFDIGPHREIIRNGYLVEKRNVKKLADKIIEILGEK